MNQRISLESIEIKGFKSFNSYGQMLELGDLTVLIGANGAGKSNFISFLRMVSFMMEGSLQKYIGINGGANSLLHFGAKYTKQIECQIKFRVNESKDLYRFVLTHAAGDLLIFTGEELMWHRDGFEKPKLITMDPGRKESELLDKSNHAKEEVKIFLRLLRSLKVYQFHDTTNESPLRAKAYLEDNKYLRSDGGNLAAVLYALKNSERWHNSYKRIVEYIRYALPEFEDFVLEPDIYSGNTVILNWSSEHSDHLFGPHQLSDGSLRFMALMGLLLRPKELLPPIIIIDEPELGLHPSAISVLASVINLVKSDTQIIIATQSSNLVDEFDAEEIVVVDKDKTDNSSKLKRLDPKTLNEWLEEYSISELWEKNVLGGKP